VADNPQVLMAVSVGLILTCIIVIILFIIFVHTMPGKIARKRGSAQAEAIEILSLLGLLIFPLWMAALVWAYMKPFTLSVALVDPDGTPAPDPESAPAPESARDPASESARELTRESASEPKQALALASQSGLRPKAVPATKQAERPDETETQA